MQDQVFRVEYFAITADDRPSIGADLGRRLAKPRGLVEVVRGPRQVGKSTGVQQLVRDLIHGEEDPDRAL